MKIAKLLFACISLSAIFSHCGEKRQSGIPYDGILYEAEYAKGFTLYRCGNHSSVLEVKNPWQGAENISEELFISYNGEEAPEGFAGTVVSAPLERVVCMSSTYVAFIDELGETNSIKGISGARYISNEDIRRRHSDGDVRDVGYDANIDYELIAGLQPDIVLIYGVAGENTAVTNKLREMRVPVMYIADYLEEDPLGKSEWLVAFGEMYGKREPARELFEGIAERYGQHKELAAGLPDEAPVVMLNAPYRDVWFVPGDRSYMVRLITDAGGAYACAGEDSSASRPISGEAAWMAASGADVWINPNQAATLREVKAQNPKFAGIKAVENGRVYNCTKRGTGDGGSDFWESGAVHADRALLDLIICLHPAAEALAGMETYYFEQLK